MYENIYLIAKLQNNGPFTVPIFTRFGAWQFFFYFFNYFQLWWEYSEIQPVHGSVIIVSNDMFTVILLFYSFDCICTMHASVSVVPYCWGHRWRHIAPQYHNNPHNARCTNLTPPPPLPHARSNGRLHRQFLYLPSAIIWKQWLFIANLNVCLTQNSAHKSNRIRFLSFCKRREPQTIIRWFGLQRDYARIWIH